MRSKWAFTSGEESNWHPLTWLSHALDCQIYGLKPFGHHFTNLFFHIANSLLLFGLLRRMTGATWASAFVAALFAWHPTHVESVAWVSERKDVLSAFFWMLTDAGVYRNTRRRVKAGSKEEQNIIIALALVSFAFGIDEQADVGHPAVCLIAADRLLASRPEFTD